MASARQDDHSFGKGALRRALVERLPNVQLPDRKKGLAVSIDRLLALSLSEEIDRLVGSRDSVLVEALGASAVKALAARAQRSQLTAYRLAILGRWETLGLYR